MSCLKEALKCLWLLMGNTLTSCPEPVKEAPGKRKKEMAKQKAAPEAKKQKVEGNLQN